MIGTVYRWTVLRGHCAREKALRAIILYPMNALVDDQMVRLRRTLDSDEARELAGRALSRPSNM
jgi:ATP-dependent helicase YprA (DUF1998 family)